MKRKISIYNTIFYVMIFCCVLGIMLALSERSVQKINYSTSANKLRNVNYDISYDINFINFAVSANQPMKFSTIMAGSVSTNGESAICSDFVVVNYNGANETSNAVYTEPIYYLHNPNNNLVFKYVKHEDNKYHKVQSVTMNDFMFLLPYNLVTRNPEQTEDGYIHTGKCAFKEHQDIVYEYKMHTDSSNVPIELDLHYDGIKSAVSKNDVNTYISSIDIHYAIRNYNAKLIVPEYVLQEAEDSGWICINGEQNATTEIINKYDAFTEETINNNNICSDLYIVSPMINNAFDIKGKPTNKVSLSIKLPKSNKDIGNLYKINRKYDAWTDSVTTNYELVPITKTESNIVNALIEINTRTDLVFKR